jgi:hypothetical protein
MFVSNLSRFVTRSKELQIKIASNYTTLQTTEESHPSTNTSQPTMYQLRTCKSLNHVPASRPSKLAKQQSLKNVKACKTAKLEKRQSSQNNEA